MLMQFWNVLSLMTWSCIGPAKLTLLSLVQNWNALAPMLFTDVGMVMPVSFWFSAVPHPVPAKALAPIPTTGTPPRSAGMV